MELTPIISVAAILIAFFALMWQMNFQSNRVRDELMEAIRGNRDAIRENRDAIRALEGRLSEVEREQARLEGENRILGDVIRQQSHTHTHAGD